MDFVGDSEYDPGRLCWPRSRTADTVFQFEMSHTWPDLVNPVVKSGEACESIRLIQSRMIFTSWMHRSASSHSIASTNRD